jgi:DMSO/TMAO reductase YedYZ molybdopterin-dependent catalytic subunit
MNMTIGRNRFALRTLLLAAVCTFYLCALDIGQAGQAQNKADGAVSADTQVGPFLELRGELPNPRRINAPDLHRLPHTEVRTTDPREPAKEVVYSGTSLIEVLKAGGLQLDSAMARVRKTVSMSVVIEAADGYRAVFALSELDPELTDRVILLADAKDGQPLAPNEGPFRIIVPGEKRAARWVRQVKVITVRQN